MGSGKGKLLQEELVANFESLASGTNTYLDLKGRAEHFGIEAFEMSLAETREGIRNIRDAIVTIMASIYDLGEEPLQPRKDLDNDVSEILEDCCMGPAAKSEAAKSAVKMKPPTTAISTQQPGNSAIRNAASARPNSAASESAVKSKLPIPAKSKPLSRYSAARSTTAAPSRGAAARARAEAAWDARRKAARARAEAAWGARN